jgi:hypothetical protein
MPKINFSVFDLLFVYRKVYFIEKKLEYFSVRIIFVDELKQ